ncbi:hypothetical protein N5F13_23085 [Comamonas thiooxydans]|uniref:hypothetical protein n=1 Tax=Comamonas thiooxydans TaxID=363952 RepID=UPI00244D4057|nr:hypothetical protein [Comamonas thiooxydans]MDH1477385.1 hypothetical protein [Comamonas thiooxydans]
MSTPHISQLRQHLLDTLADLRNRDNPMEPDRARAVAQVATVLVDSAKVEVDYLRATGQQKAGFLEEPAVITVDTQPNGAALPNGITSVTRHTLQG